MRKIAMATIWICQSYCTNCVLHILQEVSAELQVPIYRPVYVSPFDHYCV